VAAFMPNTKPLKIRTMAGTYRVTGKVLPVRGAPMMDVNSIATEGKFVSTWSGIYQGQPTNMRTVMRLAADGSIQRAVMHSTISTDDPVVGFTATFEKK
jgi:hypothetical protein